MGPGEGKDEYPQAQSFFSASGNNLSRSKSDMKEEYDFSKGERGKFYNAGAVFSFPVYLEPDVDEFMSRLAEEKNIDIQQLINEWLRANIKLIRSIEQAG